MTRISNVETVVKQASDDGINYGTHTLPKEFWASSRASILKDENFKARRIAKSIRHTQNKAEKAEANLKRAHAR